MTRNGCNEKHDNFAGQGLLAADICSALSLNATAGCSHRKQAANKAGTQLTQSYTWYDGNREQTVWVNPQAVAEFNPGKAGASAVKSADANAKMLPMKRTQGGVRLWQMNNYRRCGRAQPDDNQSGGEIFSGVP